MAWTDDLKTARDRYATQLKDIAENPAPSYSLDGESVSMMEYQAFIIDKIATLNRLIDGPFEVRSIART